MWYWIICAYIHSGTETEEGEGLIVRDTAIRFDINRNKVRKILITMSELKSPITKAVVSMRRQGMSIKEIAKNLGVFVATVSTALPYEDKMDNSLDPPEHARDVRDYWAYEREQMKRQAGRVSKKQETSKEWKGKMVGAMMEQNTKEK